MLDRSDVLALLLCDAGLFVMIAAVMVMIHRLPATTTTVIYEDDDDFEEVDEDSDDDIPTAEPYIEDDGDWWKRGEEPPF